MKKCLGIITEDISSSHPRYVMYRELFNVEYRTLYVCVKDIICIGDNNSLYMT